MSDPIEVLRKIVKLCDPDNKLDAHEELICEIYAIAENCLSDYDLVDINSDEIISCGSSCGSYSMDGIN